MKKINSQLIIILLVLLSQNIIQAQELLFAKRIGSDSPGSDADLGNAIKLDEEGNLYVTGTIGQGSGGAIFGEGEANETTLFINGSFLAKYNDMQELQWVQQMGVSNSGITSYAVDVDAGGNVYVSGRFYNEATLGVGQTNETTLTGTLSEIFLAKYDSDGNLLWALNEGGESEDNPGGRGLMVDDNGNIYLTGTFKNTVTFGEGEANETTFTSEQSTFFLAKYDTDGALIWIQKATTGGSNHSLGKNIDLDDQENIYVTGNYFNSVIFGEGLSNETTLNDSNESAFIVKYDSEGNFIWAIEPFRSGTGDIGNDLAIDKQGSVLFTGSFFGTITLGEGTENETQLSGTGSDEILVAKYNSEGEFVWGKTAESSGGDRGVGLAVDTASNVFVTGYFGDQIQFGKNERNDTLITNSGFSDLYVAKFSPSGEFIWATSAGGASDDQGADITVDESGNAFVTGFYMSDITFGVGEPMETSLSIDGPTDIFVAQYERSFNSVPTFEFAGETNFSEDFSETQTITVNQINTAENELNQIVSYSIFPESSNLVNLSFDSSTGVLEVSALENQFGEEVFTITADDDQKENYLFSKELSIVVEPVNDPPLIIEYLGTTSIEENGSLEISLSNFTVTDIDNDFPNGFSLSVQEGENYQVTENLVSLATDFIGAINVVVTVNDGELNSDEFSISFEVIEVLGLDNEYIKDKFVIYPNPTSDYLSVISSDQSEYRLSIFTIKGELVHFSNSVNLEQTINLTSLKVGTYVVNITDGANYGVMKLIKK